MFGFKSYNFFGKIKKGEHMKKFLKLFLCFVLCLGAGFVLASCGIRDDKIESDEFEPEKTYDFILYGADSNFFELDNFMPIGGDSTY